MKRLVFSVFIINLLLTSLYVVVIVLSMGIGRLFIEGRVVAIPAYDDRFLHTRLVLLDESRMVKLSLHLYGRAERLLWSPSGDELMLMTLTNPGANSTRYFYFVRDGRVYPTPRLWIQPHDFAQVVVDFAYLPDGGYLTFERDLSALEQQTPDETTDDLSAVSSRAVLRGYRTTPAGEAVLLRTLDEASYPIPSADGRWLAFRGTTAQGTLVLFDTYLLNLETLITQRIQPDDPTGLYEVNWSPVVGDNRLTYTAVQRGYVRTGVYDADRGVNCPLWQDYPRDYRNAAWSHDARQMVFATGFGNEVYVMNMPNPSEGSTYPHEPRLIDTGYPFNEMLEWLPLARHSETLQMSYAAIGAVDKVYVVHEVSLGSQRVIFEGYWEVPPVWKPIK